MLTETDVHPSRDGDAELQVSVLEIPRAVSKWHLVNDFLHFRKSVFIDKLDWQLNELDGVEYEQYDTFDAVYVVAHRGDRVCGGARLRRTDRAYGTGKLVYSYMIRDAHLGLLQGMPSELCFDLPPQSPKIWELTRLATSGNFRVTEAVLKAANAFLRTRNADECYFLGSPAFMRMARRMGFRPEAKGAVVENQDGRFLAFSCPVLHGCAQPNSAERVGTA